MIVGLPGTGIGGLYYVLLAAWLPVRELWLIPQGRSSLRRWRAIGVQLALAAGIVAVLWGEAWALTSLQTLIGTSLPTSFSANDLGLARVAPALGLLPFAILVLILAGVWLLRITVGRRPEALPNRMSAIAIPAAEPRRVGVLTTD